MTKTMSEMKDGDIGIVIQASQIDHIGDLVHCTGSYIISIGKTIGHSWDVRSGNSNLVQLITYDLLQELIKPITVEFNEFGRSKPLGGS